MANKNMVGILLVAALLLLGAGIIKLPAASAAPQGGGGSSPGQPGQVCNFPVSQVFAVNWLDSDVGTNITAGGIQTYTPDGKLYGPNTSTQQGGTYTVLLSKANYITTKVDGFSTGCGSTPVLSANSKQLDTAVVASVYNTNGITANAVGVGSNLTIGASGSGTAHIKLSQSAAYKHLAGRNNQFAVFVNSTNTTDWDVSQMSASFDGTPCTAYASAGLSNAASPTFANKAYLAGWVCTGDFASNDGSIHDLAVKLQAASGITPATGGGSVVGVNWAPIQYYQNTITNAIEYGAVKNSGGALQALQGAAVYIN